MKIKKLSILLAVALALAMIGTPALATLTSTPAQETIGATTITWDCHFEDLDYTENTPFTLTVTWSATPGPATYDSFDLKWPNFTPKSRKDAVTGTWAFGSQSGSQVSGTLNFTNLHSGQGGDGAIGTAHFKLYLLVDEDGDPTNGNETRAGFGVNIHVEQSVGP